ncbi:MAG: hypothetical protein IT365_00265 [Candidatus Hydrogenedentes bacterium]|nr:hypothetical protein [Candidatus Hydrogenedentota bacterium]
MIPPAMIGAASRAFKAKLTENLWPKYSILSRALGCTHLMYAQYIHRLHGRLGHLWQSRFYSCPLDDAYAVNAAAYVV